MHEIEWKKFENVVFVGSVPTTVKKKAENKVGMIHEFCEPWTLSDFTEGLIKSNRKSLRSRFTRQENFAR